MPINRDDIEQGDSPITPPEGDIEGRDIFEPVAIPEPEPIPAPEIPPVRSSGWDWVGSPSRPEAQEESDGISDLFRVSSEDVGASDEDLDDLTGVDIEKDILDADEDGSLDDLVVVTDEDIMGNELGQRPAKPQSRQRGTRRRLPLGYQPPTSMGRAGY